MPWRLENTGKVKIGKVFFQIDAVFFRNSNFFRFFELKTELRKLGMYSEYDRRIDKRQFLIKSQSASFL
jgi:hypothetical protein